MRRWCWLMFPRSPAEAVNFVVPASTALMFVAIEAIELWA